MGKYVGDVAVGTCVGGITNNNNNNDDGNVIIVVVTNNDDDDHDDDDNNNVKLPVGVRVGLKEVVGVVVGAKIEK